jgi:predicted LPLAT superfamily acyltransferase
MLQLHERLERGEWLAIAGDRVPLHGGRSVTVDFLGHPAFPQGPWLLAGLLKCPVNLLMCLKQPDGHYRLTLEPFADSSPGSAATASRSFISGPPATRSA